MGHPNTYRALSEIVDEALLDYGGTIHNKERAMRSAIKYAEEIWQDGYAPQVKTVELLTTQWGSIQLPPDCTDWVSVGLRNGSDVMTFVHDRTIGMIQDKDSNGIKIENLTPKYNDGLNCLESSGISIPFYGYLNNVDYLGESTGKLFGMFVKDNGLGYFTENMNKDIPEIQFKFKIKPGTKVYLMYTFNGFSADGETMIPSFYAEYIVQGIHRERQSKSKDKSGLAWTEEEFRRQRIRILDKKWKYSTDDIVEYLRSGYGTYPKK